MTRVRWALVLLSLTVVAALSGCQRSAAGGEDESSCTDTKAESGLTVDLTTTPCRPQGGQTATVRLSIEDKDGAVVKNASVKLTTAMPSMNMQGDGQTLTATGDQYEGKIVLGMGGAWEMTFEVTPEGAQPTTVAFNIIAK